jgi:Cu(I)/Ag(I) efflux system membrane fusion protein
VLAAAAAVGLVGLSARADGPGGSTETPWVASLTVSPGRQRALGLKVETVSLTSSSDPIRAPGQIAPDETRYVYISPRAEGVVRSVAAHEGQQVKAGELLATLDSPEVAQARFALYTALQDLEVARAEDDWQTMIFNNTAELLKRIKAGDSPEEIDRRFENRPIGANREQLVRAYSTERLARVTLDRNQELFKQKIIPAKQFQQVRAEYQAADAALQSLTEQMEYTARIAHMRARQAFRKAETATRVAAARLRVLGVNPGGTMPLVKDGKVVGIKPDGSFEVPPERRFQLETSPAPSNDRKPAQGEAAGSRPETDPIAGPGGDALLSDQPVSTYLIWAPFDGTILDRMMIVPGVRVSTSSHLFILADLSNVWVEVHVPESQAAAVAAGRGARVRFTTPAYPGRTFEGEVLYTGDLVDPKSRTIHLMAQADNRERRLKPGMSATVEVPVAGGRPVVLVPPSALLAAASGGALVYVQTGPDRFERRPVVTGPAHGDRVEILEGLRPGDRLVTEGPAKLKPESARE